MRLMRTGRPREYDPICSKEDCDEPHWAHGYCRLHYQRFKKHGDPNFALSFHGTPEERLEHYTDREGPVPEACPELGPCWIWKGTRKKGYGMIRVLGCMVLAYKYAWELVNGSVPDDKELHHKCEVKSCVRPDHLEPLTRVEHKAVHYPPAT